MYIAIRKISVYYQNYKIIHVIAIVFHYILTILNYHYIITVLSLHYHYNYIIMKKSWTITYIYIYIIILSF